ncbi:MAG: DNA repair protein RadA, partial [Pseudomonadota bacterium]|nr:DNA repair protein RadA [Pseudomonadota bacterium]
MCQECGAEHAKWQGQCHACGQWNSLSRVTISPVAGSATSHQALGFAGVDAQIQKLSDVEALDTQRIGSGFNELDRVLGGGFVPGSVVLIGGDPGAGKSTLLLQACTKLATDHGVLYVTGEESLQQLALRAQRLKLPMDGLSVAAETRAEVIASHIAAQKPQVVVLDSVQVLQMEGLDSTPGSVTQVRETAAFFTRLAKQQDVVIILVGHITKEGGLAGPKVLEHMIDCFMMLDSPAGSRYRTLRGHKNRFGAVNELGVFAMTDLGMKEVANPSA